MDILIITLIVLLAIWYLMHRFRTALKEKENPCTNCDSSTCKHTMPQDCYNEKEKK